ncbi:MAG: hypothetical protein ACRD04_09305, partial [Terriglobales bacterium]
MSRCPWSRRGVAGCVAAAGCAAGVFLALGQSGPASPTDVPTALAIFEQARAAAAQLPPLLAAR